MAPVDRYRIIFLQVSNLPARRLPFPQDIDNFQGILITPDKHPDPRSQQRQAEQQKRNTHKGGQDANGEPGSDQAENKPHESQDEGRDRPAVGE